ncbi:tellurium resistance protein [Fuscovulum ytuae]|uniref:Tellurium resistance protein n=1 Tax=Fuscovulum ytuae TaxID=3042299 RepID=A0ABY8Q8E4_9RHOB|nr:tellurium resistance protein [Fuscovulum sp. YMD61]WGV16954.1 tellurium resistance protein [Fuscovulum sp. YMD61]
MAERAHPRPKLYPPPQFPPRRPGRFDRVPPAVFPAILGLLGLGLALRRGLDAAGLPIGLADLLLGAAAMLWAYALFAYGVKLTRRPSVMLEDMKALPGRTGLAAATVGAMALAAAVAPFSVTLGKGMLVAALIGHGIVMLVTVRVLLSLPPEGRDVNPGWHLTFIGYIVGGLAALIVGWPSLALGLVWWTVVVAGMIWAISLVQLFRRIPPAPLRPMLAIHLAPMSFIATICATLGMEVMAQTALALAATIFVALLVTGRWITASGFSAMWAAFTFPLSAFAGALFACGWEVPGMVVLIAALGVIPPIAYRVITLWGSGRLAAVTNAAEV